MEGGSIDSELKSHNHHAMSPKGKDLFVSNGTVGKSWVWVHESLRSGGGGVVEDVKGWTAGLEKVKE